MRNPIHGLKKWRNERIVENVRKQYPTSLKAKQKKHNATKEKDSNILLLGFVVYFGAVGASIAFDEGIFMIIGFAAMIGFFGLMFIVSLWQQWHLKSKLTLDMIVVPNDPGNNKTVRLRYEGAMIGTALETPQEFIELLHKNGAHLTHAFVSEKNGTAKNVYESMKEEQKKMDVQLKLYPMITKRDKVPTFLQLAHHFDEEFRATEKSVRLSYGRGKVRYAEITVFECDPIKTSIVVKDKVVDIEYSLYTLYNSQKKMEDHMHGAKWHTPTRAAQEAASFTKKKIDSHKNESYFGILEKQRDTAVQGRKKLQNQSDVEAYNRQIEDGLKISPVQPKAPYTQRDVIFGLVIAFVFGLLVQFIIGG